MVTDITKGIAVALHKAFGDNYTIYTEEIEQGLKEPCFFIAVLNTEQRQFIGNRYQQNIPFDVHYFPVSKAKNAEMQEVATTLYAVLRQIKLLNGDLLNGVRLHHETVDDVLHFFVQYKPIVKYPVDPVEEMGGIKIENKTRS